MTFDRTADEFRFLAADAARVGRPSPLPRVERLRIPAPGDLSVHGESRSRSVSGLRFAPDRAPEIVFLHGAGLNAHTFDPTALALDAPAVSIDLPGHGLSDWRDDADYRPDSLSADVVHVLRGLVADPVTLVGHSLGGLTAALIAEAAPELVSTLVLIDITPGVSPRGDARSVQEFITGQRSFGSVEEIVDRAIGFGIGSDREALARGIFFNTRRRADDRLEWIHHFAHLDAPSAPAAGAASSGAELPHASVWEPLERRAAAQEPVALIRASSGMVDDELAEEWKRRLPGTPVVTLHGPHNLHEAVPGELAEAIGRLRSR